MTPRPTHLLRHEHRVIEQAIRALDGMCLALQSGQAVPAEALAQALDFIQNFADRFHHAREEEHLFPALEQSGFGAEGGALNFLREEHERERELLAELELATEEYQYGNTAAVQRIIEAAGHFGEHLIGHLQKEDTLLFRLAEDLLDEEAKVALMRDLAQGISGSEAERVQRYERLAAELEKSWTV